MFDLMKILEVSDYSEVPRALMKKITSTEADAFFANLKNENRDADILRDFFQERYAARKGLKQDYTPDCLGRLINKLTGDSEKTLDICSGTGTLIINGNQEGTYTCEELNGDVIPFLLFNLAFRNIKAIVFQKDVITQEIKRTFTVEKGDKYGIISESDF